MSASVPGWARLFSEFQCENCNSNEAYRSRPRGFFEKRLLPLLLLKPVRCEHCYHRVYVFRSVPVVPRPVLAGKPAPSQTAAVANSGQRIA